MFTSFWLHEFINSHGSQGKTERKGGGTIPEVSSQPDQLVLPGVRLKSDFYRRGGEAKHESSIHLLPFDIDFIFLANKKCSRFSATNKIYKKKASQQQKS